MKNIIIVGAGLAGSLLSVYLGKLGYNVSVYEKRPDMRKVELGGGRSINLALSTRGIHALKEVGLYDEIKKISIPMYGRMIHSPYGSAQLQPYGKDETEYINSVSRADLNKKLMDLAEVTRDGSGKVKIHFNERCSEMDFGKGEVRFVNEKDPDSVSTRHDIVIAADGVTSAVRMEMLKVPRFDFSQEYENYGYKELSIPPSENGEFRMYKNALHIWPRGSYMLIALPNMDGSYTCTLFLAFDKDLGGENSFEHLNSEERVIEFFRENFPDAFEMMPKLVEEFFNNPTGSLITIKCFPWSMGGKVTLLGDSCHGMVPFFGQGMNAAFEDCTYLVNFVKKYEGNWEKIFNEYQLSRKPDTDAISFMARENFIEMRDLVADPRFQLKKKIEKELQLKHPDTFIPKYSMVTFHRIPYSVALKRGKIQEEILNELTNEETLVEKINWEKADKLIREKLEKIAVEDKL
jgi:kynurenine 3-monooxygenase